MAVRSLARPNRTCSEKALGGTRRDELLRVDIVAGRVYRDTLTMKVG